MEIQLERFGKIFSAAAPTVNDTVQAQKSQRKSPSLAVTSSSAGAAEKVSAEVEKSLNRDDDIGMMFAGYGYAPPPMPKFEG